MSKQEKKNWCPEYFCIHHTHTHTLRNTRTRTHTYTQQGTDLTHMRHLRRYRADTPRFNQSKDMFFFHCISIHGKVLLNHSCCKRQVCRTGWGPLKAATHSSPCTQSLCVIPKKPSISPPSSSVPHHAVCSVHKPARSPKRQIIQCVNTKSQFKDKSQVEKLHPVLTDGALSPPPQKRKWSHVVELIYLLKHPSSDSPGFNCEQKLVLIWVASVSRRFLAAFDPGES